MRLRRYFTPMVTGTVVLLIGLSLVPVAFNYLKTPLHAGAAWWQGLVVGAGTLAVVLAAQTAGRPWARLSAMALGLVAGYVLCALVGFFPVPEGAGGWVSVPVPLKYGLSFDWGLLLPFLFIYVTSSIETLGDMTACSELSGEPVKGPTYWRRMRGGIFADGLNSMLAALLNALPNTSFSQNNGVIQVTGVAARRVGYYLAAVLVVLGLTPGLGQWLVVMPKPIVAGLTFLLFGFIIVAGVRILQKVHIGQREATILAFGLSAGIGLQSVPEILALIPEEWAVLRSAFGSSIAVGGIVVMLLDLILPGRAAEADEATAGAAEEPSAGPEQAGLAGSSGTQGVQQ
jgi:uracil-xanthine permease